MTLTLGIDVAKAKLDVALRLPTGPIRSTIIANTDAGFAELQAWRARHDGIGAHVCMEATGTYGETVAETLADAGYPVSVVNPARIKAHGAARQVRTKTDAVDARLIADFCASQRPPLWTPPPPARRELRARVARREALVARRTQEQNRLPVTHPSVRPGIEALIAHLNSVIAEVEAAIRRRIDDDPELKAQQRLLDSVPGLGDKTIPVLLSFYGGPGRFDQARQAATNRAAACAANLAFRKWDTPACARRFTCRPWSPCTRPLGVGPSGIDSPPPARRPWSSSAP